MPPPSATHLAFKNQLDPYSEVPAPSFSLTVCLKLSLQGGKSIFAVFILDV